MDQAVLIHILKTVQNMIFLRMWNYVRKYRVVLDEINMSSSPLLQPLKLLANYLSQPTKRDAIVVDLDAQVSHISFDLSSPPTPAPQAAGKLPLTARQEGSHCRRFRRSGEPQFQQRLQSSSERFTV